jgi:hypothetical protein
MAKSQQMRWSRRGADLLLQVRAAVYTRISRMAGNLLARIGEIWSDLQQLAASSVVT